MQTFRKKFSHLIEEDEEDCYRPQKRQKQRQRANQEHTFKCRHCHIFVVPVVYGGQHRNHCPTCLYSRHVDDKVPGDRASSCRASMQPIGYFLRPKGEHVVVHLCMDCGIERFNRIAADDDFELLLSLPQLAPRTSREMKLSRLLELPESSHDEETETSFEQVTQPV